MNADQIFEQFVQTEDKGSAGRGKKRCNECGAYVGVRTHKCECGYEFIKGKSTKQTQRELENAPTEEERLYAMCIGAPGGRLVYAASGSLPFKLEKINKQTVSDYCNLVVNEGIRQGCIYTIDAIKKYIQHQYGYNSPYYKCASELVDKWYNEKMGIDTPSSEGVEDNA